ncbi:hypothetical protein Q7P37_008159 [Cladosporium fusiforme]
MAEYSDQTSDSDVKPKGLHDPKFGELLDTGLFSDFTVTCNGDIYKVHKAVLYAHSEYFRKMLQSTFKVTLHLIDITSIHSQSRRIHQANLYPQETHTNTADLSAEDPTILKHLIHYIYHSKFATAHPSAEELVRIYFLADMYFVNGLCSLALSTLHDEYRDYSNIQDLPAFVEVLRIANPSETVEKHGKLWDKLLLPIIKRADDLLKLDSFKELLEESPELTHAVLRYTKEWPTPGSTYWYDGWRRHVAD